MLLVGVAASSHCSTALTSMREEGEDDGGDERRGYVHEAQWEMEAARRWCMHRRSHRSVYSLAPCALPAFNDMAPLAERRTSTPSAPTRLPQRRSVEISVNAC